MTLPGRELHREDVGVEIAGWTGAAERATVNLPTREPGVVVPDHNPPSAETARLILRLGVAEAGLRLIVLTELEPLEIR